MPPTPTAASRRSAKKLCANNCGVMWCSSAVNCIPLFLRTASRTPSSPIDAQLIRLSVRGAGDVSVFPLTTSLSSTTSAGPGPLFDGFSGTTDVSDFSATWAAGLRLLVFPAPPGACAPGIAEISQFLCEGLPDVHGAFDRAGSEHDWRVTLCSVLPSTSHTRIPDYAAHWLPDWFPLSTHPPASHDATCMTRGLVDSPFLTSIELSSTILSQL